MAGGLISGKRRRLEEKKNQGGPLHQCNEPKGINELRKGIRNKSMLEWIQSSDKKYCPQIFKVGNKTEFSRAYAFRKFAFSFDC